MSARVVGIDPGLSGGLALITSMGAFVETMPLAGKEIDAAELAIILKGWEPDVVYVERVHSFPKQGSVSTFNFGMGYGTVKTAAIVLGYRLELVAPQAWKKAVLADTLKDKDAAIDWARRSYPLVRLVQPGCRKAHSGVADALAIAEFGRLREGK